MTDRLMRIQMEIEDRERDYAQNRNINLADAQWLVDEVARLRASLQHIVDDVAINPINVTQHARWAAEGLGIPMPPTRESHLTMHDIHRLMDS
jgi:hypothetical protein